jgi:prenyltransferase beta subunit
MAEVLGIVASGISVAQIAGQLLACVKTLRSLSRAVRDLPDDLCRILDEAEILGRMFYQLEALNKCSPSPGGSNILEASLAHCAGVAATLEALATRANVSFKGGNSKSRPWEFIKALLKKDELEELKNRLESAKSLLHLAVTCYSLWVYSSTGTISRLICQEICSGNIINYKNYRLEDS